MKEEKWKATGFKSFSLDKRDTAQQSANEIRRKTDIKVCTCTKLFPLNFSFARGEKLSIQ